MRMAEFIPARTGESSTGKKIIYHKIVVRLEDQLTIPFDDNNRDYQDYLAWLELGNEPLDFNVDLLETQEEDLSDSSIEVRDVD
jgi:hypothetical protein